MIPQQLQKIISVHMADVPKSLYRRYLEVSEATFQALLKNHSVGDVTPLQADSQFLIAS
jgi:hypothetical protein